MKTSDFDYHLPESSIAQTPVDPRDSSRLLVLDRKTGGVTHNHFREIGKFLNPGDLLVFNQTRVIPARLFAHKSTGGRVELLLLRREDLLMWECLAGGKGLSAGKELTIENGPNAKIVAVLDGSRRRIRFSEPIETFFPAAGHVPLPPYIHTPLSDPERYQTVYARDPGSAAAPTAGLHFTPQLLDGFKKSGVNIAFVTLHVGLDTFAPVTEDDPADHLIHTEWCELSQQTTDLITQTSKQGGRIVAVGTTSVRTLESLKAGPPFKPFAGPTELFILPGYKFKLVDVMVTNFHLPKSTLLMLVSAFAGREMILDTYKLAIKENYRFYSFGDAMLIL